MADEKANNNNNNNQGGYGGNNSGKWTQPRPDARGSCPNMAVFNDQTARKVAEVLIIIFFLFFCDKE